VRLEEGKHFLVGGNGLFVQQPLPHLVHLFETPSVLCYSSIPRSGRPMLSLRTPLRTPLACALRVGIMRACSEHSLARLGSLVGVYGPCRFWSWLSKRAPSARVLAG
jgi:hypothetical protein